MLDNTGFLCVGDETVIMKMMMSFSLYFRSLMSQKCFKYIKLEILSSRYKTSWASLPSERRPWHGRWWCPWKQCMLDQFVFRDDELPFNDSMTACQWFLRGVDDSWTYFLGAFFFCGLWLSCKSTVVRSVVGRVWCGGGFFLVLICALGLELSALLSWTGLLWTKAYHTHDSFSSWHPLREHEGGLKMTETMPSMYLWSLEVVREFVVGHE